MLRDSAACRSAASSKYLTNSFRSTRMSNSFSIALSGLSAANTALDVTSNNIANANTIGFKNSQSEFADVFASSAVNLNTTTGGEGVQVVTAAQQFTQGDSMAEASTPLDMERNGNGFFTMNSPSGLVS